MTFKKGSAASPVLTDAELRAFRDSQQRAPLPALTASTLLVRDTHANRPVEVISATAVNIDMPATATINDEFPVHNLGAGTVTMRTSAGGALTGNALLPPTLAQYEMGLVRFTSIGFVRVA